MILTGAAIWTFLGGWRGVIMSALLAFSVGTAAYYVREYDRRGTQLATIELKNTALNQQIEVHKANERQIQRALDAVDKELSLRDTEIDALCKAIDGIAKDQTPGSDDDVHAIIRKAIEAIRKGS